MSIFSCGDVCDTRLMGQIRNRTVHGGTRSGRSCHPILTSQPGVLSSAHGTFAVAYIGVLGLLARFGLRCRTFAFRSRHHAT